MTLAIRAPVVPGAPSAYDPSGFYDEAFLPDGRPRRAYAQVVEQLAELDLGALAARMASDRRARSVTFGGEGERRIFHIDPVPRIFERAEWTVLEHGLAQRARALNRVLDDVYGERTIVDAGVIPARVLDGAEHFEPWMLDVPVASGHAPVVGFDVVRRDWLASDAMVTAVPRLAGLRGVRVLIDMKAVRRK